ncbi:MAG: hypothetical protein A2176_10345 [Spirochaetes bacterium RBG_13_51_14]|nr:MAG: hypothetical protein A2176_10345 [Spirochaetes bacterium RBG_13_51_14]
MINEIIKHNAPGKQCASAGPSIQSDCDTIPSLKKFLEKYLHHSTVNGKEYIDTGNDRYRVSFDDGDEVLL